MTVNYVTGEIIDFDKTAAERRAQQIETRLTAVGESFTIAMQKIREAIELRDDIALGYRSPGDYVSARFGRALSGLPVEMRREAVRELTEAGMSTRAIAPVVGASKSQVAADRQVSSPGHLSQAPASPEEGEATGDAGQTSAQPEDARGDASPSLHLTASGDSTTGSSAPAAPTPRPAVTGIDGKTYPRPESKPRQSPRKPLRDGFRDASLDLDKIIGRWDRLVADDRYPRNKNEVARYANDLIRAREALDRLIEQMSTN